MLNPAAQLIENIELIAVYFARTDQAGRTSKDCWSFRAALVSSGLVSFIFCQSTDSRLNSTTVVLRGLICLLLGTPAAITYLADPGVWCLALSGKTTLLGSCPIFEIAAKILNALTLLQRIWARPRPKRNRETSVMGAPNGRFPHSIIPCIYGAFGSAGDAGDSCCYYAVALL